MTEEIGKRELEMAAWAKDVIMPAIIAEVEHERVVKVVGDVEPTTKDPLLLDMVGLMVSLITFAKAWIEHKDDEDILMPILAMVVGGGGRSFEDPRKIAHMAMPQIMYQDMKKQAMAAIPSIIKGAGAMASALIIESWLVEIEAKDGKLPAKEDLRAPSEDDRRVSTIIISADSEMLSVGVTFKIKEGATREVNMTPSNVFVTRVNGKRLPGAEDCPTLWPDENTKAAEVELEGQHAAE